MMAIWILITLSSMLAALSMLVLVVYDMIQPSGAKFGGNHHLMLGWRLHELRVDSGTFLLPLLDSLRDKAIGFVLLLHCHY